MQSFDWPAEHCTALREHFVRGLSFAQIAAAINATFGTAYTRSAAIGRARRMGLTRQDRSKGKSSVCPNGPGRRTRRRRRRAGVLPRPRGQEQSSNASRRQNCAVSKSPRAIFHCLSSKPPIAAIRTAAIGTVKPLRSAVTRGASGRATARRIFI